MADIKQLNIDTGVKEFVLNGSVSVFFNPADASFAEKIYQTFHDLDSEAEKYQKQAKALSDSDDMESAEIWKLGREMDARMRERVNSLFGLDVCTPLIGSVNIYAIADGLPIWANILFAIIDEMEASATEQAKLRESKMAKYTAKYQRKRR